MEIQGNCTPKRGLMNYKQYNLNVRNDTPIHSIKRRKSFIPVNLFKSFKNNNDNSNKETKSKIKSSKRNISKEINPEEQVNKNKISKKIKSVSFANYIDNIYSNESHLNKKMINNKIKKNYISNKTLFSSQNKRISTINSYLDLSQFNIEKNVDNLNITSNKDGFTINSNYKSPINRKICEKIDNLLHKEKLTKNEKEIVFNYFKISRDFENSSKHKKKNINNNTKSPKLKKRQKKNMNSNFKEKNKSIGDEKTEKAINENEEINNIKFHEIKGKRTKINFFKAFLCCLETN